MIKEDIRKNLKPYTIVNSKQLSNMIKHYNLGIILNKIEPNTLPFEIINNLMDIYKRLR